MTPGQKKENVQRHFYYVHGCLDKFKRRELDQDVIMKVYCLIMRCMIAISWSDFQSVAKHADGTMIIGKDDQKAIFHWKEANAIRDDESRPRWNNGMNMTAN